MACRGEQLLVFCEDIFAFIQNELMVEPTHLKNIPVKLDHETPRIGVNIQKTFETTT